ncbi:phage protein [Rodentibacter myodis]|uniref:Phage tail protein n=1 Tax=Rodentibacter myodis TaxID=1907939 RepID=A0A1V3JQ21_9PAST|nr:phage protein [Rodentibacter myodis]OOF58922.1 phage tail protein [Rodentibacter myodis]
MERISGMSFDFYLFGFPIHAESISLSITDNSAVALTRGIPDGWVSGDVAAEGEIELDEKNFNKIATAAAASGSYRSIPETDFTFFAMRGGVRSKVETFGNKLILTDILNIDPKGGAKTTKKIKYFVTSPDFVRINGVPYLSDEDTRDLIG